MADDSVTLRIEGPDANDDVTLPAGLLEMLAEGDETDAEVVGFGQGVLGSEDDAAELPRIYVHPDYWDEGAGSEMLARIEELLAERGAERLRLIVLADNEVGNAFYESHGYGTVGSRESEFEGERYTDYVREKEL